MEKIIKMLILACENRDFCRSGRGHSDLRDYLPRYNYLGLAIFDVLSFLNSIHCVIQPTVLPMTKIGVNIDFGICRAVRMIPV